jgi:hypothetical protein
LLKVVRIVVRHNSTAPRNAALCRLVWAAFAVSLAAKASWPFRQWAVSDSCEQAQICPQGQRQTRAGIRELVVHFP